MSEATAEAPTVPPEGQETTSEEAPKTFDAEYVEKLRKENAKYRTEAKAATAEVEKVRQSSMSEAEKAVAEAELRGRSTATAEFGKRLATSRFEALASKRNPDFDTAGLLGTADEDGFINLSRFVGDDGEPDEKAITAAVEKLVPPAEGALPNFDGGSRTSSPAPVGMTGLIRKAAGRA